VAQAETVQLRKVAAVAHPLARPAAGEAGVLAAAAAPVAKEEPEAGRASVSLRSTRPSISSSASCPSRTLLAAEMERLAKLGSRKAQAQQGAEMRAVVGLAGLAATAVVAAAPPEAFPPVSCGPAPHRRSMARARHRPRP
jgi:hypothetical protein